MFNIKASLFGGYSIKLPAYAGTSKKRVNGTLPSEMGLWASLRYFSVGNNYLSGSLPSEIGLWTNMTALFDSRVVLPGAKMGANTSQTKSCTNILVLLYTVREAIGEATPSGRHCSY